MQIYKMTNTVTGKIYIGQTINSLSVRRRGHKSDGNGKYKDKEIYVDARLAGWDNIVFETIEWVDDPNKLDEREAYWIKHFDTTNPTVGYNIYEGGQGENYSGSKAVRCLTNGKEYVSVTQAAKDTGLSLTKIAACCRGTRYSTGKMRFEYINEKAKSSAEPRFSVRLRNYHTGELYNSILEACSILGFKTETVSYNIRNYKYYEKDGVLITSLDFEESDLREFKNHKPNSKSVMRLDTGEIFKSISDAAKSIGKHDKKSALHSGLKRNLGTHKWQGITWELL